ncbi:MAG TPA: hypothetical protein VIF88_02840 [Methylocystis sp.]
MRRYGLGVIFLGLALALSGAYGMWAGWDYIQLERGWSLFIGGATAVSGGVVTIALGRAIGILGRIADKVPQPQAGAAADRVEEARAPQPQQQPVAATPPPKPPVEVDRYIANGSVYVMFSDGSVEVRTDGAARRYPSLAALRADTGAGGG